MIVPDQTGRDVDADGISVGVVVVMKSANHGSVEVVTTVTWPAVPAATRKSAMPLTANAIDDPFQLKAPESW